MKDWRACLKVKVQLPAEQHTDLETNEPMWGAGGTDKAVLMYICLNVYFAKCI